VQDIRAIAEILRTVLAELSSKKKKELSILYKKKAIILKPYQLISIGEIMEL